MQMKTWALSIGLGAAAGAIAVMMLPRECTARKLANRAADAVEGAAQQFASKMMNNTQM